MPRTTGSAIKRPQEAELVYILLLNHEGQFYDLFESTIAGILGKFVIVISNTNDFKGFKRRLKIIGRKITEADFKNIILANYTSSEEYLIQKELIYWFRDKIQNEWEEPVNIDSTKWLW